MKGDRKADNKVWALLSRADRNRQLTGLAVCLVSLCSSRQSLLARIVPSTVICCHVSAHAIELQAGVYKHYHSQWFGV